MPCAVPENFCTATDTQNYGVANYTVTPTGYFANMGWVGFVNLRSLKLGYDSILRVTSCDINVSQEITKPDVIDGRIDKSVYQMGPKIVEGSISMPIVADIPTGGCPTVGDLRNSSASSLLQAVWCWATSRGQQGRLLYNDTAIDIRYANHAAYSFDSAIVNTMSLSVTQGDAVNLDIAIIGRGRTAYTGNPALTSVPIKDFLSPARVLTWNDITVTGVGGCSRPSNMFFSNQVREFNMEINNNADRFFTLNGSLFPVDINVGKREITGSLTLLGFNENLRVAAETNQNFFTEKNEIRVAMYIGEDTFSSGFGGRDWTGTTPPGQPIFAKRLAGVVFQIEEVGITNEVLETTVNWSAMAVDSLAAGGAVTSSNYTSIVPDSCDFPQWQ